MTGAKPAKLHQSCPQGHTLIPLGRNYTCDVCTRTSPSDVLTVSYCCLACDWDVCPTHCLPYSVVQEQPSGSFHWVLSQKCKQQHPLQLTARPIPWFCNICNKQSPPLSVSAYCMACDYDSCISHIQIPATSGGCCPPVVDRSLNSNAAAASLSDVQKALNDVASPRGFQCQAVSWEDAQRGTVGGALSCWGGNISDVRLWERGGRMLYTLRSQNWNERLGYVSSKGVALMIGNESAVPGHALEAITLESYLRNIGQHAAYAKVETPALYDATVDGLLSIRFQTVFLPVGSEALAKTEFCSEVYNYNTHADDDPRNLLLLCTPQGTSVQQDGRGAKKVFFHQVDDAGVAKRYWLEAERSNEKVGGEQKESAEAAAEAWARGKSVAVRIGTQAMGTRFNVQMLIQLPLQQKKREQVRGCFGGGRGGGGGAGFGRGGGFGCAPMMACAPMSFNMEVAPMPFNAPMKRCSRPSAPGAAPVQGTSNAARVSRGTQEDVYHGVANRSMLRDPSQHGTITVTMYYTVAGGVPSPADIKSAVDDLDLLYKACPSDKRLVDCSEVTAELTVKAMQDVHQKVTTEPYKPASSMPVDKGFPQ